MTAFTRLVSQDSPERKPAPFHPVRARPAPLAYRGQVLVQRKSNCACGGGCRRCRAAGAGFRAAGCAERANRINRGRCGSYRHRILRADFVSGKVLPDQWRKIKYDWLPLSCYGSFASLKKALLAVLDGIGQEYQIIFS